MPLIKTQRRWRPLTNLSCLKGMEAQPINSSRSTAKLTCARAARSRLGFDRSSGTPSSTLARSSISKRSHLPTKAATSRRSVLATRRRPSSLSVGTRAATCRSTLLLLDHHTIETPTASPESSPSLALSPPSLPSPAPSYLLHLQNRRSTDPQEPSAPWTITQSTAPQLTPASS